MHIVILLLILIVFILLGGGGLIVGLIYSLFIVLWGLLILAWAALPWIAGGVILMFAWHLAPAFLGAGGSNHRRSGKTSKDRRRLIVEAEAAAEEADLDRQTAALLASNRKRYEEAFGPVDKPDPWLEAARKATARRGRRRR